MGEFETNFLLASGFKEHNVFPSLVPQMRGTLMSLAIEELSKAEGPVPKKLDVEEAKKAIIEQIHLDEKTFRWMLCENAMATEKLYEGIRNFAKDTVKLEKLLQQKM